jgi:Arc/MetJ family transcription regulator
MRTNIEIDDILMADTMKATGLKTKKATVDHALRLARQMAAQKELLSLMGKVKWVGDLDEMRRD